MLGCKPFTTALARFGRSGRFGKRLTRIISVLLLIGQPARVQAQRVPLLQLPDGRSVEVLGLQRWTVAMLQDSFGKAAPKESFGSGACAAIIRYSLGFADANVMVIAGGPGAEHISILVREPQDSALVHYRKTALTADNPERKWLKVTRVMAEHPGLFRSAVATLILTPEEVRYIAYETTADSILSAGTVSLVKGLQRTNDKRLAETILANSPNVRDRAVAVLILAGRGTPSHAWHSMLLGMLESDGPVKSYAVRGFSSLVKRPHGPDTWTANSAEMNLILDGTSLPVLVPFVTALVTSDVGPAQSKMLLHRGGFMLTELLRSNEYLQYNPAHALLVKLRGKDLGVSVAPWRAWIAGL